MMHQAEVDMAVPTLGRWCPPVDRLDSVIVDLIRRHEGLPCPTRRTFQEWTGMPRRRVWPCLADMQRRGLIEVEVRETRSQGPDPKRRRLRVAGGEWTGWTARTRAGDVGAS